MNTPLLTGVVLLVCALMAVPLVSTANSVKVRSKMPLAGAPSLPSWPEKVNAVPMVSARAAVTSATSARSTSLNFVFIMRFFLNGMIQNIDQDDWLQGG